MLGFFIINKEKNMKSKFLLVFSLTVNTIWSVGEAGAIFLLIAPGAGPQGTGEAQVAKADDAYASYYNPAGLGFLEGREVAGMHVNWLPNLANDLYYEFITYRHHIKGLGTVGGHLIYLNLGEQIGMDEFGNPTLPPKGVINSKRIFDHTYKTPNEALKAAEWFGCGGNIHYHAHEKVWMPCSMN